MKTAPAKTPNNPPGVWIKVTDQMPKQWEWIIAYDASLGQVEGVKWTGRYFMNNHHDRFYSITHWMPEPQEPPQAECEAIRSTLPDSDPKNENDDGFWHRPIASVFRHLSKKYNQPELVELLDGLILREFVKPPQNNKAVQPS